MKKHVKYGKIYAYSGKIMHIALKRRNIA